MRPFVYLESRIMNFSTGQKAQMAKTTQSPDTEKRKKVRDPLHTLVQDWRDYKCNTWHLEPTVRFVLPLSPSRPQRYNASCSAFTHASR